MKSAVTKRKGRGFSRADEPTNQYGLPTISHFESLREEGTGRAQRSVEGWVLFITGLHEEATEEDLQDRFGEYGQVRSLKINLDHRTGYVKGYGLIEYGSWEEAKQAVDALDGATFMDGTLQVDFAFIKG